MDEAWAGIAQVSQKGDANIVGWCAVHGGSCRCPFHGARLTRGSHARTTDDPAQRFKG